MSLEHKEPQPRPHHDGSDQPSTWVDDVLVDSVDHSVKVNHTHYRAIQGTIPRIPTAS